nr:venom gland protein U5-PHTX-Pmx1h [Physocyclus mexicanus]
MNRSTFGLAVFAALVVCVLCFEKENLVQGEETAVEEIEERECSTTGKDCNSSGRCCDTCYVCKCRTAWGTNCWCDYRKMSCDSGK